MDRPVVKVRIEDDGGALITIEPLAGQPAAVRLDRYERDILIKELIHPGPIRGWACIGGRHAY